MTQGNLTEPSVCQDTAGPGQSKHWPKHFLCSSKFDFQQFYFGSCPKDARGVSVPLVPGGTQRRLCPPQPWGDRPEHPLVLHGQRFPQLRPFLTRTGLKMPQDCPGRRGTETTPGHPCSSPRLRAGGLRAALPWPGRGLCDLFASRVTRWASREQSQHLMCFFPILFCPYLWQAGVMAKPLRLGARRGPSLPRPFWVPPFVEPGLVSVPLPFGGAGAGPRERRRREAAHRRIPPASLPPRHPHTTSPGRGSGLAALRAGGGLGAPALGAPILCG